MHSCVLAPFQFTRFRKNVSATVILGATNARCRRRSVHDDSAHVSRPLASSIVVSDSSVSIARVPSSACKRRSIIRSRRCPSGFERFSTAFLTIDLAATSYLDPPLSRIPRTNKDVAIDIRRSGTLSSRTIEMRASPGRPTGALLSLSLPLWSPESSTQRFHRIVSRTECRGRLRPASPTAGLRDRGTHCACVRAIFVSPSRPLRHRRTPAFLRPLRPLPVRPCATATTLCTLRFMDSRWTRCTIRARDRYLRSEQTIPRWTLASFLFETRGNAKLQRSLRHVAISTSVYDAPMHWIYIP